MQLTQRLLIKIPTFQDETDRFLQDLVRDGHMKTSYMVDPIGVMRSRLSFIPDDALAGATDDKANRLLFSILAKPDFVDWLQKYQSELTRKLRWAREAPSGVPTPDVIDRKAIMRDLADAIMKHGDREILANMFDAPVSKEFSPVLIFVVAVVVLVAVATVVWVGIDHDFGSRIADAQTRESIVTGLRAIAEGMANHAQHTKLNDAGGAA